MTQKIKIQSKKRNLELVETLKQKKQKLYLIEM